MAFARALAFAHAQVARQERTSFGLVAAAARATPLTTTRSSGSRCRYMPRPRARVLAEALACLISDDLRVARPRALEACRPPVSASTLERAVRDQAALQRGDLDGGERRVGDVLVLVICPEQMGDVAHPLGEN